MRRWGRFLGMRGPNRARTDENESQARWSRGRFGGSGGPCERRDLTDWIEAAEDKVARKGRMEEVCALLATGKRGCLLFCGVSLETKAGEETKV
jgi:hypothetical protein